MVEAWCLMAALGNVTVNVKVTTVLPMAWRHHCGFLNDGSWPTQDGRNICRGCRADIRLEDVSARYLLVELDSDGA